MKTSGGPGKTPGNAAHGAAAVKPDNDLNAGHRKRLLGRYMNRGDDALYDYELLELLLSYAIPRRDVKPLAKRLLAQFGSIGGVFCADNSRLAAVSGIGERTIGLIRLVRTMNEKILFDEIPEKDVLSNPEKVADFVRMKIGGGSKESFMFICLDARNGINGFECFPGTVDRTTVYNRELAEKALAYRAVSVIVAHNHPSGFCEPSADDVAFTVSLQRSLNAVGVHLHDHLIVSRNNYYSMRAAKRLENEDFS